MKTQAQQAALPTRGTHRPRGIFRQSRVSGCSPRAAGLKRWANMPKHVLYAYVEEGEIEPVHQQITEALGAFVSDRRWISGEAWSVDQRKTGTEDTRAWDLGVNLELPDPDKEPRAWFTDIEAIAVFARDLAERYGLQFVIGVADQEKGFAEDLFSIGPGPVDIEGLRAILGDSDK